MRNNWRMEQLQQKIKTAAMTENDPKRRSRLWHLYYLSLDVQADYEEIMRESEMIGARNPAFEGDYVGWLDDDFEDRPQLLVISLKTKKTRMIPTIQKTTSNQRTRTTIKSPECLPVNN